MTSIQESCSKIENAAMSDSETSPSNVPATPRKFSAVRDFPSVPLESFGERAETHCPQLQTADETTQSPIADSTIPMNTWLGLDPKYASFDRIQWWILTGGILVLSGMGWLGYCMATWSEIGLLHLLLVVFIGLLAIVGYFCGLYFPKRVLATSSWQITAGGIEIRRGIWWKHRIYVPHDRIQHTDVQQGPIARIFELATLVINTGGTHQPSIPLEGLNHRLAEQLRNQLTALSRPHSSTMRS